MDVVERLDILEPDDYASLKCQCGRHIVAPCVCEDINKAVRGCDVICVTNPMLITGELWLEGSTPTHSDTQANTYMYSHVWVEVHFSGQTINCSIKEKGSNME